MITNREEVLEKAFKAVSYTHLQTSYRSLCRFVETQSGVTRRR